jgi:hypothetical protein
MTIDNEQPKLQLPVTPDLDRLHIRAAEKNVMSQSERFMRDLLGDEGYEAWDND